MTREERELAIEELQGCIIAEEHGKDGKPNGNVTCELTKGTIDLAIKALEQEPKTKIEESNFSQEQYLADIQSAYDCGKSVIDKIRAEIAEYGSIWVAYAITKDTKTDKGIEKLVNSVLKQAKEQVLQTIDKYRAETEDT